MTWLPLTTRPLALVLLVPADAGAVVGAPDPGVIDDGVVGVDVEVDDRAADACAADAEEDVGERDGIAGVVGVAALRGRPRARTGDSLGRRRRGGRRG